MTKKNEKVTWEQRKMNKIEKNWFLRNWKTQILNKWPTKVMDENKKNDEKENFH